MSREQRKTTLERRDFFRRGLAKVAGAAVDEAEKRANKSASRWIRPPYAINELDFLLKCTRCDDCVDACPHDVLFPLPPKFGLQVASTPAMDLINKGCRMCSDWPCVAACTDDALVRPDSEPPDDESATDVVDLPLPLLASAMIDIAKCLPYLGPECGACADSCPVPDALIWNGPKPHINQALCTGCAMCRGTCIVEPKAVSIRTLLRD